MSSPGDPFDPSLAAGFGQRDPGFEPAPIFAESEAPFAGIHACLDDTDLAWSRMSGNVERLMDAADRLQKFSAGADNDDIIEARNAISQAARQVQEARDMAHHGYDRGLAYLRQRR
jgi:hypothetical protein